MQYCIEVIIFCFYELMITGVMVQVVLNETVVSPRCVSMAYDGLIHN